MKPELDHPDHFSPSTSAGQTAIEPGFGFTLNRLHACDIRQSATGGTTVGIGRRINENIRLGVEAGTDSASGRVVIDLDITEALKARGEAGHDGTGKGRDHLRAGVLRPLSLRRSCQAYNIRRTVTVI